MNQYEFYSNFFKYRGNKEDVKHSSTYGDYYHKIENYYGPGKSRYFKTREEYDAYQNEQKRLLDNAKKELAANKVSQQTSGRDAAIKNSQPTEKEAKEKLYTTRQKNAIKWLEENEKYEANKAKQVHAGSYEQAKAQGEAEQRYKKNSVAANNAAADRAEKEKHNASMNRASAYMDQKGREAAIKNSQPLVKQQNPVKKAANAMENKIKENIAAGMRKIQESFNDRINKNVTVAQNQRYKAINNSMNLSEKEWKERLKEDAEYKKIARLGGKTVADMYVAKKKMDKEAEANAKKKAEEDAKSAANAIQTAKDKEYVDNINKAAEKKEKAENKEQKKKELDEKITQLQSDSKSIKSNLDTIANSGRITDATYERIESNPLYESLNSVLKNKDGFTNLKDYLYADGNIMTAKFRAKEVLYLLEQISDAAEAKLRAQKIL